jgi:predicted enzyme related to lactoylglutathione lyase
MPAWLASQFAVATGFDADGQESVSMKVLNILVRRYLPLDRFETAMTFYEVLIGQKARLRFDYHEHDLRLAQVSSILFVAGTEKSLAPFVETEATFMVDDIQAFAAHLPTVGAHMLKPPKAVPTGWNMLVRHPDGMRVEYVEHRDKHPADRLPDADYPERPFA